MFSKEKRVKEERIDPITLEPIPDEMCIQVRDMYFDISTLYMAYAKTKKMENPYTREQLSCDIVRKVRAYGESKKIQVNYISHYYMIDPFVTLGECILSFEKSDVLSCRNIDVWDKSIYCEDLTTPIEKYEKEGEIKLSINGTMTVEMMNVLMKFARTQPNTERLIALLNIRIEQITEKETRPEKRIINFAGHPMRLEIFADGTRILTLTPDDEVDARDILRLSYLNNNTQTDRSPQYILNLAQKYPNIRRVSEKDFYRDELLYTKEPENILLCAYNEIRDPAVLQETLHKCVWFNKKLVVYPDIFQQLSTLKTYGNKRIKKNLISLLKACVQTYGWPMKRNNGTIIDEHEIPRYILEKITLRSR